MVAQGGGGGIGTEHRYMSYKAWCSMSQCGTNIYYKTHSHGIEYSIYACKVTCGMYGRLSLL